MTELLDRALAMARNLPEETQDDIARIVLQLAGNEDALPITLSEDERGAIAASKAAALRGEFATDEQVRTVWASAIFEIGAIRSIFVERFFLQSVCDFL